MKKASGKLIARVVCSVAVAAGCVSAIAYAAQPSTNEATEPEQAAVEQVTDDQADELAPLTEDIYYQGSAAPTNEPYFADEDRIVLDRGASSSDVEQAA